MTGGRLLLAATPLGQPGDASSRLLEALATADVVAAEDTRRVRLLAKSLAVAITGKVVSLFDANEAARVPVLLAELAAGATVLVVSDAGMPLVSDPGYRLVRAARAAGLRVSPVPGASALNWRTSIVDLLKLLGLDSSLAARKELAVELFYNGNDEPGSAAWNIWLHKQVMRSIAANGGTLPPELRD